MSIFSDDSDRLSADDLDALETIDKMRSVIRRSTRNAVFYVPFIAFGFIVPFIIVLCTDINPLWGFCFLLPVTWLVVFPVSLITVLAGRRIKRCEDTLLTGIKIEHENMDKDICFMRNVGLIRLLGEGVLISGFPVMMVYFPYNSGLFILPLMVLMAFIFMILMFFLDKISALMFLAVGFTLVDMIAGSAPMPIYLLPVSGALMFGGSYLVEYHIKKKLEKYFEQNAENRIKPLLESMMTVEKFNSTERLPYIDFDAIDYDGNCYTYGKWNGTEVAFSNISFLTGISEKMKIRFYLNPLLSPLMFTGFCVYYTADSEVTEKMLEIIRYNLRQYKGHEVFLMPDNRISVLLKNGYYFVEDRDIKSVCDESRLACDAAKLEGVLQMIRVGLKGKRVEPKFLTLVDGDIDDDSGNNNE